jgi:hypothetical protein
VNVKNKDAMMKGFDKFAARMSRRYDEVRDCLSAGRYEEAQMLLSDIATSHARTSLSLRNVLVKNGVMEENK